MAGQVQHDWLAWFVNRFLDQCAGLELGADTGLGQPTHPQSRFLNGDLLVDVGHRQCALAAEYAGMPGGQ